jgi:hypothetical protein
MDLRGMPCLTPILLRWNLYTRRDSDLFAPLSAGLVSDYSPYSHANSLFKAILQGCRALPGVVIFGFHLAMQHFNW